jgi:hypothetical protein
MLSNISTKRRFETFHKLKIAVAAALCLLGTISSVAYGDAPTVADAHGGSNYTFYHLDNCSRNGSGVIPNYDTQKALIDAQLQTMYRNGQRSIGLNLFFMHGGKNVVLDSTGGDIAPKYKQNLAALLATIKKIGFENVLIKFAPQGMNHPWNSGHEWPEWHEDMYQEHLSLIKNLHPIFVASGVHYMIDLLGEAIPASNQPMLLRYTRRLWADYTRAFGNQDTVGFSIIPKVRPDRIAQIPEVYGGNPPPVLDMHLYDDAYTNFVSAHERLKAEGYGDIPWIIAETYYNDPQNADELSRAVRRTGQKVLFLLQWPLTRANACREVDVPAPLEFDQYLNNGF